MLNRIFIIFLYLAIYVLLYFSYINYIVPVWGYYGFYEKIVPAKVILGGALTILLAWYLPTRFSKPSHILMHLQVLVPIMPMLAMYGASDQSSEYMIVIIVCILIIYWITILPRGPLTTGKLSESTLLNILFAISMCHVLLLIAFGGLNYLNFDVLKVYDYRRDSSNLLPPAFGYITPIVTKVAIPMSMVLSFRLKKYSFLFIAVALSLMEFALTHHRSPLFYPVFVLFVSWLLYRKNSLVYLLIGFVLVTSLSLVPQNNTINSDTISSLLVRRTLFTTAQANYGYHLFFQQNPKLYLSNSKLTLGLIPYPYRLPIQLEISKANNEDSETWANTGWIGTSYMHFGYFGCVLFAIIIGFTLRYLDKLAITRGGIFVGSVSLVPFFALFTSADLPTAYLTHGILFLLIIISLYKPYKKS